MARVRLVDRSRFSCAFNFSTSFQRSSSSSLSDKLICSSLDATSSPFSRFHCLKALRSTSSRFCSARRKTRCFLMISQ